MKKIICFSKFINFNAGGAERSTVNYLKEHYSASDSKIDLISFENNRELPFNHIPASWKRSFIKQTIEFTPSYLIEYFLNKMKVKAYFNEIRGDVLLSYGVYTPVAVNTFSGDSIIFIRSEYDLAIDNNYHTGFKKILKFIYQIVNWPLRYLYQKELKKAFENSKVIVNSAYMKKRCEALFEIEVNEVCYPQINQQNLKTSFKKACRIFDGKKGVVFVGDSIVKGMDVALAIAEKMPEQTFYFFTRAVTTKMRQRNIIYHPWSNSLGLVYSRAQLVIVPSKWEEAYGRVAKEALLLKIPVIVSNRGGLPEAVDFRDELIVNSFDPDEWVRKIKIIRDGYHDRS